MANLNIAIKIAAEDQASGPLSKITGSLRDLGGMAGGAAKQGFAGLQSIVGGGLVMAAGAAVGALTALGGVVAGGVVLAMEQERVERQLAAVLESTGHAAGLTATQIKTMAAELQSVTTFGDETIISGQNLLLTFTQIGADVFPQATEAMLDIATAMGGDVSGAAQMVGKALNNPIQGISALSRVGIQFTDDQKKMIETMMEAGDVAGAQAVILCELEMQFGGSARAAAETFGGRMQQLKNMIGDVGEQIGFAFLPLLTDLAERAMPLVNEAMARLQPILDQIPPVLERMATAVGNFVEAIMAGESPLDAARALLAEFLPADLMTRFDEISAAVATFVEQARAVIDPIATAVAEFVTWQDILIVVGIVVASIVLPALYGIVAAALPVIAVAAGLIAAVALLRNAWTNNWGDIQGKTAAVMAFITETIPAGIERVRQAIQTGLTAITTWWQTSDSTTRTILGNLWQFLQNTVQNGMQFIQAIISAVTAAIRGDWTGFGAALRQATDAIWSQIANIFTTARDNLVAVVIALIRGITGAWGNTDWSSLGRAIVDGIVGALGNGAAAIADAARNAARAALDAAKGFLGISSPSRVAAQMIGLPFAEGMAQGIGQGSAQVGAAASGLAGTAVKQASTTINHYYNVSANYAAQSERTVRDDIRMLEMLSA
jgi:phage-related protein